MRMLGPVLIGLAGAAVSSIGITVPSVWYDEAATVSAATRGIPELIGMLGNVDAVHGLYYLLMHAVFGAVGYSPLSLRIVSALAVGLTAALVVVLDRRVRPGSLGLVAGLVFCVLPRVAWAGVEGRSFALTALVTVVLSLVLARAGSPRSWVLYGVIAVVGCTLFLYFALVVLAHGVGLALTRRAALRSWALSSGAAAVALVPFGLVAATQSSQLPGMPPLGLQTPGDVLVGQWFGSSIPLALCALALIGIGVWRNGSARLVLPALVVPTLALLAAALLNPETYQPRYLTMVTPFVAIAIAAGLVSVPWRAVRFAALAALVGLAVPQVVGERLPDAKKDTSWAQIADLVAASRPEAVIFGELAPHTSSTARVIAVAYPDAFEGLLDVTLDESAEDARWLWATYRPLAQSLDGLDGIDTVALITTKKLVTPTSDAGILIADGWHATATWRRGGVTLTQFER